MSAVIRHLNIAINGKPIVDDVDLDIADGERVGLVGSSGSGKSMIARAMMGLLPATAQVTGSVELGGTQIVGASDAAVADLRGRYVGMVFQNPSAALNPVMTVAQQVGLPLYLHYDLSLGELPAGTVGRPTAACRHRHGACHFAAADHRRRADHRVGFDHATADRGPAHVAGGRIGRVDAVHHARFRGAEQGHHTLLCA